MSKIKIRYAVARFHRYIEHEDDTITRENGSFKVFGNRLTDAGCKLKTPEGCIYDGMEIVTDVYEVDESVIIQHGTLIKNGAETE